MAVITATPVTIDPTNFSRQAANEQGPFEFKVGSNAYQVLINNQVPVTPRISIYKSTDGGSSWAEQDQAGTPPNIQGQLIAFQEADGTLDILYRESLGNFLQIVHFDTATDTYGTPTVAGSTILNLSNSTVFYRQSGGTYVVVYTTGSLRYLTNSGGVWSGPTLLRASTGLLTGVVDATDVCHLFTSEVGFQLSYRQLSAAFSLGSVTTFTGNVFFNGGGTAIIWGGSSVAVLYARSDGTEQVQIGTPLASPVFTAYTSVFPSGSPATYSYPLLVEGSDGVLNAFITAIENPDVIDEIRQSVFDGVSTWGAPIVFYDEITNPPPDSDTSHFQFIHTASAVHINGLWIYATAMETSTDDGVTVFCTGFALIQIPVPPEPGCPTIYVARQPQPDAPPPPLPPGM